MFSPNDAQEERPRALGAKSVLDYIAKVDYFATAIFEFSFHSFIVAQFSITKRTPLPGRLVKGAGEGACSALA